MISFVNFCKNSKHLCGFSSWYIAWLLFSPRLLTKFEFPARMSSKSCVNVYQKSTQQGKLVRNSLKLDEKFSRGISYSGQIVFFQFLQHYTCFSSAICPLQVPA